MSDGLNPKFVVMADAVEKGLRWAFSTPSEAVVIIARLDEPARLVGLATPTPQLTLTPPKPLTRARDWVAVGTGAAPSS